MKKIILTSIALLSLTACGGGGGDDGAKTPAKSSTETPAKSSTETPATTTSSTDLAAVKSKTAVVTHELTKEEIQEMKAQLASEANMKFGLAKDFAFRVYIKANSPKEVIFAADTNQPGNFSLSCSTDKSGQPIWDQENISGEVKCNFNKPGSYVVRLRDHSIDLTSFNTISFKNNKLVTEIITWGNEKWGSLDSFFDHASIQQIDKKSPAGVTSTTNMFKAAYSFNSDLSKWDVSQITNMEGMFSDAVSFNSDLSKWDVSQSTNMKGMFKGAGNFASDLSGWNTSEVINMHQMFFGAAKFNSPLNKWDIAQVEDTSGMFENAKGYDQDLSSWKVVCFSKLTPENMFKASAMAKNTGHQVQCR